ncbi:MAG: glycosyltransferase [Dehalococcoidia bacterium]
MSTLVIAYDLPPAPNAGARRLEEIVGQAREAIKGRIVVLGPRGSTLRSNVEFIPFGVPLPAAGEAPWIRLAREARLALWLSRHVRWSRYDRAIMSSPLFVPTVAVAAVCRRRKIAYFLDVRDPYPTTFVEAGLIRRNGLIHLALLRAVTRLYSGARIITAATKGLAQEIRPYSGDTPVYTARNGHNGTQVSTTNSPRNRDGRFRVFCHGNFGAFQDLDVLTGLIEGVVQRTDHVDFSLVGRGAGRQILEKWVDDGFRKGRVNVLPPVPPDQLATVLWDADLGLSIRGGDWISRNAFPVRITDYLELGIPVLVSPHSEAGQLVNRLGVGACFPNAQVREMVEYVVDMSQRGEAYLSARAEADRWGPCFARSRTMRRIRCYLRKAFESDGAGGALR